MIFFFGVKNTTLLTEKLAYVICNYCNVQDALYVTVISSYFHIFWIPIFPTGKKNYSYCTHCKQTLAKNQMPASYKTGAEEITQKAKTPIWQFTGLLILAIPVLFILAAIIFGHK